MNEFVPCRTRRWDGSDLAVITLGDPLLDDCLTFAAARARVNTGLAVASDLKIFFEVVGKPPAAVSAADVFASLSSQRAPRRGERVIRLEDGEAGLAARTIARRLSSVRGLFAYLAVRADTGVTRNPVPTSLAARRVGARRGARELDAARWVPYQPTVVHGQRRYERQHPVDLADGSGRQLTTEHRDPGLDVRVRDVWRRERSHRLDPPTQRTALRKVAILDAADTFDDTNVPAGNRLEKLHGDRIGQYSIRVNQQWWICFRWTPAGPEQLVYRRVESTRSCTARGASARTPHYGLHAAGTSERFWMNLQGRYDLEIERDRLAGVLDEIRPLASA